VSRKGLQVELNLDGCRLRIAKGRVVVQSEGRTVTLAPDRVMDRAGDRERLYKEHSKF
jgi:hypothetical protein